MRPFTFHASQIIFCWEGDTLSWAEVTEALERWSVGTTTSLASMTALPHHSWWHTEVSLVGGHSVTWSSCWLHWELGQYQMLFKQSVWNVTQIYCNIKKKKKKGFKIRPLWRIQYHCLFHAVWRVTQRAWSTLQLWSVWCCCFQLTDHISHLQ